MCLTFPPPFVTAARRQLPRPLHVIVYARAASLPLGEYKCGSKRGADTTAGALEIDFYRTACGVVIVNHSAGRLARRFCLNGVL